MKSGILIIFTALASFSLSAVSAEPKYDVCRTQLHEYVASRFGSKVTRIDFRFDYDDRSFATQRALPLSGNQALVYTDGCEGYHVFDLEGSHLDCTHRAHYGTPRNYVRYRSSAGECKKAAGG